MELPRFVNLKWHVVFWSGYITYEVVIIAVLTRTFGNFWDYLVHYVLHIFLFYFHAHIILPTALNSKKWPYLKLTIFVIGELAGYVLIKYVILWACYFFKVPLSPAFTTHGMYIIGGLWRAIYFLGVSTAYWFALSSLKNIKVVAQLERDKLTNDLTKQRLEKALLITDNAYLKSQINPHFLLNTLNFLYNSVSRFNEKIAESVMALSEIMSYALTDPDVNGKVRLESEIEHIENFIKLNQARFDKRLFIDFVVDGDIEGKKIVPMVLITLTENVFKFGELLDPKLPAKISLNVVNDNLSFVTENYKKTKFPENSQTIGVENVKNRLAIHNEYKLEIAESKDHYRSVLKVCL